MKLLNGTVDRYLTQLPKPWIAVGCLLGLLGIGGLDYVIQADLGFSIFYVLPIGIMTWYVHPTLGLGLSLLGSGLWFLAEWQRLWPQIHPFSLAWNTCVRLGFFLLVVQLQSDLLTAYEREKALARSDSLTGLLNRRAFLEVLAAEHERSQRHRQPFTLAYLDVDNFKQVNDHLGHAAGDDLLQAIATVLTRNVRAIDHPARLGGDEFAILMPATDTAQATQALTRLFTALTDLRQHCAVIGFSLGAVTFHTVPVSTTQSLALVDALMYTVKASGKHNWVQKEYP